MCAPGTRNIIEKATLKLLSHHISYEGRSLPNALMPTKFPLPKGVLDTILWGIHSSHKDGATNNELEYKFPELSPKSGDIEAERKQGKGTLSITIYLLSFRRTWLFNYRQTAVTWDEITGHNTYPEVLLLPIA